MYQRGGEGGFGGANRVEGGRWRGFGQYYWLVGRRAVEFGIWGQFVGGDFRAVGGGSLAHGRFLQVQSHVSVKRQAEAHSVCVSRVQDRTCVGCNATVTGVL